MTKVYSYPGLASAHVIIPVGKAALPIDFTKGYVDSKMSRPAVFATSNPTIQAIIENSSLFNTRIFLNRTFGEPEAVEVEAEPEAEVEVSSEPAAEKKPAELKEYPEVTTWEDAVRIVKTIPGVKAQQLRTMASVKRIASANGIVFPNYNFE